MIRKKRNCIEFVGTYAYPIYTTSDKVQVHKILTKRQKSRSLRTEMKKLSKPNQGH